MADIQNGSHRLPAYFEWWYFHFVTEEGSALNLVLHETDIFGLNQSPYLSLSVLLPDQAPRYLRCELNGSEIGGQQPYLRVGEGLLVETDRAVYFDIPFAGRGHFSGEMVKLAPPLAIQDGILYRDGSSGRASHWVVQVPHAAFTAVLQLDGTTQQLTGVAYHDHQWGTIPIQDFVSDWVWGHFSNEQTAVVFFHLLTQHGRAIERVATITKAHTLVGTRLTGSYLNTLFRSDGLDGFVGGMELSFFEWPAHLAFYLAPKNQMRQRLNEAYGRTVVSYVRWAATAEWQAGQARQQLAGITEYLRVRLNPIWGSSLPTTSLAFSSGS